MLRNRARPQASRPPRLSRPPRETSMKRQRSPMHDNHERWLVSYADFITLLFAFFVVMFATAQKDKTKQKIVSEAVRAAIQHGQLTAAITGIVNHTRVPPVGKGDSREKAPPPEQP